MKKGLLVGAIVGALLVGLTYGCLGIFTDEEGIVCVLPLVLSAPIDS